MSEFEQIANDVVTAMETAEYRISEFGYGAATDEAVSAVNAGLVTWLISSEERRLNGSFRKKVLDQLPNNDDPNWQSYISPQPTHSLKRRLEALWDIRIAYTHTAADVTMISNAQNQQYAIDAPRYINGCELRNNILMVNKLDFHTAVRSIVQVRDILK
ncbi:hypothetical protein [Ruegeria sp. HKCCD7221]|uniref:hypothetical protein n=1 Tax=Ruegeria sp. HKCCD7221 TaxID=2683009 RepID=UPI0014880630|nr:hypothetical protein [Ruegeria sp. HKCCD7221]